MGRTASMTVAMLALTASFAVAQTSSAPATVSSTRDTAAAAYAAQGGAPATSIAERCGDVTSIPDTDDPRWRWRLAAYHHLDCVIAIVDRALGAAKERRLGVPVDGDAAPDRGVVATTGGARTAGDGRPAAPLTREELQRIRTLAWWARDAAARIGQ